MEIRQLRYFIAVADGGNLSNAARQLNVSQPPVTRQIHQLEEEVGHALFTRSTKGVELTPAGAAFLVEARRILAQTSLATERANAAAQGRLGRIDIGYFGSVIYTFLPGVVRRFRDLTPDAEVSLHQIPKKEQVEALRDGRLHIGFARYYPYEADIAVESVSRERLYFAVPSDTPSALRKSVALEDLRDERLILFPKDGRPSFADEIITMYSRFGGTPHVTYFADDAPSALALTAAGLGSTFVPGSVASIVWPGVVFIPVVTDNIWLPIDCIYLKDATSPILTAFLDAVSQETAAGQTGRRTGDLI
jgi:DNA-binding transcriptional LysR family regulator